MKILAVDTTSTTFTAVLIDGDKTLAKSFEVGKSGHSSLILPTIADLLTEGGVEVKDLDGVAVPLYISMASFSSFTWHR